MAWASRRGGEIPLPALNGKENAKRGPGRNSRLGKWVLALGLGFYFNLVCDSGFPLASIRRLSAGEKMAEVNPAITATMTYLSQSGRL